MTDKNNKYNKWEKKQPVRKTEFMDGGGFMPPQAVELEEAVLGAIMLESHNLEKIMGDFSPMLFYKSNNAIIAQAIMDMFAKNQPIDILTVTQHLKGTGELELVGGAYYITTLTNRVASSENTEFHIKILQQKHLERFIIKLCTQNINKVLTFNEDVFDTFSTMQMDMDNALKEVMRYEITDVNKINEDLIAESIKVATSGIKSGVPTGLTRIDNITNGWQKSDLIILAGRPGMGKALSVDSKLITPSGIMRIGDVVVGQYVLGSDGNPYYVTGVYPQGKKDAYRVTFDDDTFVDCCIDHLWSVTNQKNESIVLKTSELVVDLSIKIVNPLQFNEQPIPIDPYTAGVSMAGLQGSFNKIHDSYLFNTIEVRERLLAGFMSMVADISIVLDTSIMQDVITMPCHEIISNDMLCLIRGLGGKATYKTTLIRGTGKSTYNEGEIRFYLPMSSSIFVAPEPSEEKKLFKYITKIEKTGESVEMVCISVNSPDSLFITDGFTLTHNTSAALCMALKPAIELSVPILFFSLEMSKKQVVGRVQSYYSEIDVSKIIKKQLQFDEIDHIAKTCGILKGKPLFIDDTPAISLLELKSKARKMAREHGIEMIVIDYLQLMRSGMNIQSREQEVAEISKGLKALAKELDIPVIALAQLSRKVEERPDKKPMLSDLRESGSLEQDADMVIFTYRPEYYGIPEYDIDGNGVMTSSHELMMFLIEKHRNGAIGEAPLRFIGKYTKITNLSDSGWGGNPSSNTVSAPPAEPKEYHQAGMEENSGFLNDTSAVVVKKGVDEDTPF
jgi:replicative DNA helicase